MKNEKEKIFSIIFYFYFLSFEKHRRFENSDGPETRGLWGGFLE